jgi:polysaccharide biosynthesis protein PslG
MYDAMKGNSTGYFDMLGVHGTGWAVPPETDPQVVATDPRLHNGDPSPAELKRVYAFRHVEDVRELMVRNGDAAKRIVILEFGWTTDNRPNSPYYWHGAGAGITEQLQGQYLVDAFRYAAEHWQPWIGLMTVIYMPDVTWTKQDEQYWWSLIGPGYPDAYWRAPYIHLCAYLNKLADQRCKYDPGP